MIVSAEEDLLQLQKQRIGSVLCLLSDNEFELYGVPDLLKRYADSRFTVMHAAVVDQAIPSFEEMDAMLAFVDSSLAEQRRILVHCVGGLGRSGTVAACAIPATGLVAPFLILVAVLAIAPVAGIPPKSGKAILAMP